MMARDRIGTYGAEGQIVTPDPDSPTPNIQTEQPIDIASLRVIRLRCRSREAATPNVILTSLCFNASGSRTALPGRSSKLHMPGIPLKAAGALSVRRTIAQMRSCLERHLDDHVCLN